MQLRRHLGLPARLDYVRAGRFEHDRRSVDLRTGRHLRPLVDGDVPSLALDNHRRLANAFGRRALSDFVLGLVTCIHLADDLDRCGRSDQRLVRHHEAVALAMLVLECRDERPHPVAIVGGFGKRNLKREIGAVITKVQPTLGAGRRHADILVRHFAEPVLGHLRHEVVDPGESIFLELYLDGLFAKHPEIGEPHPVGRQHPGKRVDQDTGHTEHVGDTAGMLPACPAKAGQGVTRDVVAPAYGNFLDRIGHVLQPRS